jgi:hypothetical protein
MVTHLGMPRKDVVIPLDRSKGGRSFKKGCGHPNEGCGHSLGHAKEGYGHFIGRA